MADQRTWKGLGQATRADMHAAATAAAISNPQPSLYDLAKAADPEPEPPPPQLPVSEAIQHQAMMMAPQQQQRPVAGLVGGVESRLATDARGSSPVLTGVEGMEIINEMFQRQARRLESQFSDQSANRNSLEVLQSQLQVVQAQLQWQSARSHETSQQATQSSESVARMTNYMNTMESDRARAAQTAQRLARAVTSLRSQLEASDPQKYAELMPHLSELTMTGCNLASLDGIGELFAAATSSSSSYKGGRVSANDDGLSASGSATGSSARRHTSSNNSNSNSNSDHHDTSSGNEHPNADNSSSESADNSSAPTWPKVAARRSSAMSRSAQHGAHKLARVHPGAGADGEREQPDHWSGSCSSSTTQGRDGSPPEGSPPNDSSNGDSNGSGSDGKDGHSDGSDGNNGESGSPPLHPLAAGGGGQPPPYAATNLRQGLVDPATLAAMSDAPPAPTGDAMEVLGDANGQGRLHAFAEACLDSSAGGGAAPLGGGAWPTGTTALDIGGEPVKGGGAPAVIQGVLPFPGQGVVDLQQGVIDHSSLESFPLGQGVLAAGQPLPSSVTAMLTETPAKRAGVEPSATDDAKRLRSDDGEATHNMMDTSA